MTLLADILAQVTLLRVFVFSILFLVVSFIVDLLNQPRYPDSIPILGHDSKKWFSTIRNSFAYFTQHQAWTGEGYEKVTLYTPFDNDISLIVNSMAKMGYPSLLQRHSHVLQTSLCPGLKSRG